MHKFLKKNPNNLNLILYKTRKKKTPIRKNPNLILYKTRKKKKYRLRGRSSETAKAHRG
eukprot:TRINITY_DN2037_c0_g1_i1.p1 TRINITY_DN2037_c0_g1~~TRINITY_DN2037_c0_g1_i1.p1  ORF type:complete len:59 (+),score=26.57 TRINITY_DN2037_c0_g1_i1:244-420(+)